MMPSSHLILCCPLLPPSIFPSIRFFSNESVLHIRWPKNWSFSFNISPSNEHPGLVSFRMDWLDGVLIVIHQECCSFLTLPLLRAETSGLKSIPVDDSGGGLGGRGAGEESITYPRCFQVFRLPHILTDPVDPKNSSRPPQLHVYTCSVTQSGLTLL